MQIRILKKKVQQIEGLEARGAALDPQQLAKLGAKPLLESALALLEQGTPLPEVQALLAAAKEGWSHMHLMLLQREDHAQGAVAGQSVGRRRVVQGALCHARHPVSMDITACAFLQARARIMSWAAAGAAAQVLWVRVTPLPASRMSRLAAAALAGSPLEVAGAGGTRYAAQPHALGLHSRED